MVAHVGNAAVEPGGGIQHHGYQILREFDVNLVEIKHIADGFLHRTGRRRRWALGGSLPALMGMPGRKGQDRGTDHERQEGHARHQRDERHQQGDGAEGTRKPAKLGEERNIGGPGRAAAREEKRGTDRDDDGGDLVDQTVADREDGIGLKGVAKWHVMDKHTHDKTHHQVQHRDQQPGYGIALDEFGGAVKGAEKVGLRQFAFPAQFGLGVGDGAGGHVGVNGKLLAGHAVQRKPGAHLGHASGTLGDHDEVDDQKDDENHQTQQQIAAHDEFGKSLDHVAGSVGSGVALPDDQFGRGHVQRQPQHQRGEQDGGEGRKIQRPFDEKRHRQHQDCQGKRQGKTDVQKVGRNWQDHHQDHAHQGERQQDGGPEHRGDVHAKAGHQDPTPIRGPRASCEGTSDPALPWPPACSSGKRFSRRIGSGAASSAPGSCAEGPSRTALTFFR